MQKSVEETFNIRQLRQALRDTTVIPNSERVRSITPEACLVCISLAGPGRGKRIALGTRELVIGRDVGCSLPIPDQSVSRQHARIEGLPTGGYQVSDLGSTNGTYINDIRVRTGRLEDGSYLRVGDCIFRFLAGGNVETDYHRELQRLTNIDPLTGLHNRRYLNEYLDVELEKASLNNRGLAVILFDIDHFKTINDRLGHLTGDFILKSLATRLQTLTRPDELLARYGGEEFALVLSKATVERAAACAERFRRAVDGHPFEFEGQACMLTVSAGVGFLPSGGLFTASDLFCQADEGLYNAKRAGRNRVAPIALVCQPSSRTSRPITRAILRSGE